MVQGTQVDGVNRPFGRPSPRVIPEDYFLGWPLESEVFRDYMHWATLELTCDPQFHFACFLAIVSHELVRRGYKTKYGPNLPLSFCLVGGGSSGKSSATNLAIDFLRESWRQAEITFPDQKAPIVQCDGSVPGLFTSLHRFYQKSTKTTCALLHSVQFTRMFRERDPVYPILSSLIDGQTYEIHTREMQKLRGKKPKAPDDGVPDTITNPRISIILGTSLDNASDIVGINAMITSFLSRVNVVCAGELPDGYVRHYVPDYYPDDLERAQNTWSSWLVRNQIEIPDKTILYSGEVIEIGNELEREADEKPDEATRLRITKDHAMRLAGVYTALHCRSVVTEDIFWIAYRQIQSWSSGTEVLENAITASEVARIADKVETLLMNAGPKGIPRSALSRRLKLASWELDNVIAVLHDRNAVVKGTKSLKDAQIVYYEPTCLPDHVTLPTQKLHSPT